MPVIRDEPFTSGHRETREHNAPDTAIMEKSTRSELYGPVLCADDCNNHFRSFRNPPDRAGHVETDRFSPSRRLDDADPYGWERGLAPWV